MAFIGERADVDRVAKITSRRAAMDRRESSPILVREESAAETVVEDLKRSLSDPRDVCAALGLGVHPGDRQLQSAGITVRCPRHHGVSLSVTRGQHGALRFHCFGCRDDFSGDVLDLIAEVENLSVSDDFPEVVRAASRLANRTPAGPAATAEMRRERVDAVTRSFPPIDEVSRVWEEAGPCAADGEVSALLADRGLSASAVDEAKLARVIAADAVVPNWARFRGSRLQSEPWPKTGHRLVLPVYDESGAMRSLRAWCTRTTDDPKRLPPARYRAAGLVLACPRSVALLQGTQIHSRRSLRILIVEGEPDFLTWCIRAATLDFDVPLVIGVTSGSWSERFAARIPVGARVIIRTHHDPAGDRYAESIRETLSHRCAVLRTEAEHAR